MPKIQVENPTVDNYSIYFQERGLIIPLKLWGVFSYFPTYNPKSEDILDSDEVYLIKNSIWNLHDKSCSSNEDRMLEWEVNPINKKDRRKFLYIEEDATIAVISKKFIMEKQTVETLINATHQDNGRPRPVLITSPREVYQVYTLLTIILPTLDNALLHASLYFRQM